MIFAELRGFLLVSLWSSYPDGQEGQNPGARDVDQ